jgi:hypothetical protein
MGRWSTYEIGDSIALDMLAHAQLGQLLGPVDDCTSGFRLMRRTAKSRDELASKVLIVGYGDARSSSDGVTRTRSEALGIATELAMKLRANAEAFDELQLKYCDYSVCAMHPFRYLAGRSPWIGLDRLLLATPIHGITSVPIEVDVGFVLARREDPEGLPKFDRGAVFTELPTPARITLDTATESELTTYLERIGPALANLPLGSSRGHDLLTGTIENLKATLPRAAPKQRNVLIDEARNRLRTELSSVELASIIQVAEAVNAELQGVP